MMPTFIDGWRAAQDWISDVRPRRGTWADSVVDRLKEFGLTKGRIGIDGLAGPLDPDGWLPHSVYTRLRELLPQAELINLDDMMEMLRTVKSEEELQILYEHYRTLVELTHRARSNTKSHSVEDAIVIAEAEIKEEEHLLKKAKK